MLTDAKIKSLRPRDALYRVTDAAGLGLEVAPSGAWHSGSATAMPARPRW